MAEQSRGPVNATHTSLRILEELKNTGGAGPTELSGRLDKPISTVHDHLKTLESHGYVANTGEEYELQPKLLEFGGYVRKDMKLFRVAQPQVQQLALEIGQHANLMIEDGGLGVFLFKAKGEEAVQLDTYEGMRVHLHTTALGKSMLAFMPEDRVESIIEEHGLPSVTESTIGSRTALFDALEEIRERGYATDDEERVRGMRCVAAPVRRKDEVLGAVSVSGPTSDFRGDRFEEEIPSMVRGTANIIEVNMTYSD